MSKAAILESVAKSSMKENVPEIRPGDTVRVMTKVGGKERPQAFEGLVIAIKNGGIAKTITVRKISSGIGVEKTFPVHSPNVTEIQVLRHGVVRRAKLYYLRDKIGKAARIRERR